MSGDTDSSLLTYTAHEFKAVHISIRRKAIVIPDTKFTDHPL